MDIVQLLGLIFVVAAVLYTVNRINKGNCCKDEK